MAEILSPSNDLYLTSLGEANLFVGSCVFWNLVSFFRLDERAMNTSSGIVDELLMYTRPEPSGSQWGDREYPFF